MAQAMGRGKGRGMVTRAMVKEKGPWGAAYHVNKITSSTHALQHRCSAAGQSNAAPASPCSRYCKVQPRKLRHHSHRPGQAWDAPSCCTCPWVAAHASGAVTAVPFIQPAGYKCCAIWFRTKSYTLYASIMRHRTKARCSLQLAIWCVCLLPARTPLQTPHVGLMLPLMQATCAVCTPPLTPHPLPPTVPSSLPCLRAHLSHTYQHHIHLPAQMA